MAGVPQNTTYTKLNDLVATTHPPALLQRMLENAQAPGIAQARPIESKQAKLTDLCPEEKRKIGELVKKLAEEKKLREE